MEHEQVLVVPQVSNDSCTCSSGSTTSSSSLNASSPSSGDDGAVVAGGKKRPRRDLKHPTYRGVRMRTWGKWPRAHDVAAIVIKGRAAHLNFPDTAHELPRAASAAPKDVQAAAALAAAAPPSPVDAITVVQEQEDEEPAAEPEQESPDCVIIENAAPQENGGIELAADFSFFDVPDALLEFAFTTLPEPPSYCGSPWDDFVADDLFLGEPLLLWEH
ncbi:hypothetical protein ACQ4PT_065187 [Festuca glaucescens]